MSIVSVLFLASLCKTIQFSKVYCFKLPCVKQYSFQKGIVLSFGSPKPLFYRCKLLAMLKTIYFVGLLGKTPIEMKSAIAIGGWLAEHDVASLFLASLCKTIQFSKVYCFKIRVAKPFVLPLQIVGNT